MTSIQITLENSFQLSVRLIVNCDYLFEENRISIQGCQFNFFFLLSVSLQKEQSKGKLLGLFLSYQHGPLPNKELGGITC